MELIKPQDLIDLPKLYSQEELGKDAIAYLKFFTPDSSFTWYVTEFDGIDTFFGLVDSGWDKELGYFTLSEIQTLRGKWGLPVEKDLYFKPCALNELLRD